MKPTDSWTSSRPEAGGLVKNWLFLPKGKGPKGLVIFLHGTGNDALFPHATLFSRLLADNLGVFCFDLDGHGRESTTLLGIETLASCLETAWQQLPRIFAHWRGASAPLPIHLMGHSLGGALLLAFVSRHPTIRVASCTLIASPLDLKLSGVTTWKAVLSEVGGAFHPTLFRQLGVYGPYGLVPAFGTFKRRAYPLRLKEQTARKGVYYLPAIRAIFDRLDLKSCAPLVQAPTLLCYGRLDGIAPLSHAHKLQTLLPHAECFIEPRGTHFTTLLSENVEKRIIQWLNHASTSTST